MKSVLLFLAFAMFGVASARAESVSLVCDGQSLDQTTNVKNGKIAISVRGDVVETSPNYFSYQPGYDISAHWLGANSGKALKAPGVTCGVTMPSDIKCNLDRMNPGIALAPFTLFEACGVGAFDTSGQPHQGFSTGLTISNALDHGYFYCAAHDTDPVVAVHIELSHCQKNQ